MKKRLIKLITLLLSVVIGIAGFSGCRLVTKNSDRDLDQVVATVNVNQEEYIYKKDLVMGYMNYGYLYVQYYGYTAKQTYNLIINNLIDNRIVVQVAYEEFEENADKDETKAKYTPERYLSAEEITDAKYSAYKSINDMLDSYSEDNSYTEKKDTLGVDVRTIPTDAQNAEKDVDKAEYVKNIDDNGFDVSGEFRRAAFNKVYNLLKEANLLGDDYKGDIRDTEYFKLLLKGNYENEIIKNYEESVLAEIKASVKYGDLEKLYEEKVTAQQAWSNSDFVSALSSASATSPILYSNQNGTYGYVYNLLIGINDYQSEKISALQEQRTETNMDENEYAEKRAEILAGTIAKDLRSSWILSGYDFDFETKTFTGDYTFAEDADNSLPFQGELNKLRDADEEHNLSAVYSIESVKTFDLEKFTEFVNEYVYGDKTVGGESEDKNIYREYVNDAKPDEYDAKINELLFAFSTDPGSVNTYKGYVIKPDNNEYVKTFGDAGKALLEAGGSSYKVVASDYGYHFMFFSEVWTFEKGYTDLDAYLETLGIDDGAAYLEEMLNNWDDFEEENNFLYILTSEWISAKLSDASARSRKNITFEYRYGEHKDCTKVYEDRFADLLG